MTAIAKNPAIDYLDKALSVFPKLGLTLKQDEKMPIERLIARVSDFGPERAMVILMVLIRQEAFNALVRENISDMDVGTRFEGIASNFAVIRNDALMMVNMLENGTLSVGDRFKLFWMNMSRGSIPKRFKKIGSLYKEISESLGKQVEIEEFVITSYADNRMSMKYAQLESAHLLEAATVALGKSKQELESASAELEALPETASTSDRVELELKRDEKKRALEDLDDRYQIAKDLSEQIAVTYSTSEYVYMQIAQITKVKKRLYDRGVAFFYQQDSTLTGLSGAFTTAMGLNEGTKGINSMNQGISDSLEALSSVAGKAKKDGLRAGYGQTIRVESYKKFVDATLAYEESTFIDIAELRKEATDTSKEIVTYSEDGKRRLAAIMAKV